MQNLCVHLVLLLFVHIQIPALAPQDPGGGPYCSSPALQLDGGRVRKRAYEIMAPSTGIYGRVQGKTGQSHMAEYSSWTHRDQTTCSMLQFLCRTIMSGNAPTSSNFPSVCNC